MSVTVAIIGGGPAGATCAWKLAKAGVRTLLYERDPGREKPCGGGLTGRAFAALPELRQLGLAWTEARQWRLVGDRNREVDFMLDEPLVITSRRELDSALRREAVKAGAALVREPVRALQPIAGGGWLVNDHAANIVIGAGGMIDPLARKLGLALNKENLAASHGLWVKGQFEPAIVTCFLVSLKGYLWWFPRRDHASYGVVMPHAIFSREKAHEILVSFAAEHLPGVDLASSESFGWTGPAVQDWQDGNRRYAGADWLLVGDAAGLCDVTTGEGLSYALASGSWAAEAILQNNLKIYDYRIRTEMTPELAKSARLQRKFFSRRRLNIGMWFLRRSRTCQRISQELAHGRQSYLTFKKRMLRESPRMLVEACFGLWRTEADLRQKSGL